MSGDLRKMLLDIDQSVLAKSDGKSLDEHITECFNILNSMVESIPQLNDIIQYYFQPFSYWESLFIIICFHDLGKVHREFQKLLQGQNNHWNNQRHEFYSLPFVDKIACPENTLKCIKYTILSHHKTFEEALGYYDQDNNFEANIKTKMISEYLKQFFHVFPQIYQRVYGKAIELKSINLDGIIHPVKQYAIPYLRKEWENEGSMQNLLIWGGLKTCDHYASAGVKSLKMLIDNDFSPLDQMRSTLLEKGMDFYNHQLKASKSKGSVQLSAPTGSGKTEAALLWLQTQLSIKQGRSFYVLPYTASINAMYLRLKLIFEDKVGLHHSRLNQFLYSQYSQSETHNVHELIRNDKEEFLKMINPIKITTPFQFLKHFYGVKHFEMGLIELAGCKMIFDEIHAYDSITFAQILEVMKFLTNSLKADIFVMTATLPSFIKKIISEVLQLESSQIIEADQDLLKIFTRHKIQLVESNIENQIDRINYDLSQGKRVLVVCNTVNNAQKIFQYFCNEQYQQDEICLLHSRFTYKDRQKKEEKALDPKTRLLIGTQAIEVSLNIDYDVLYSEPAPIDALLQRFGRINRERKKGICTVKICTISGKNDHFIYPTAIVKKTLDVLKDIDTLSESTIQSLIDLVYPDWEPEEKKKFDDTSHFFNQAIYSLKPYQDSSTTEEQFYEQFTNVEILPFCFIKEWEELINNHHYIEAEGLFVSIHKNTYGYYRNKNLISSHSTVDLTNDKVIKTITAKLEYNAELGLLKEVINTDIAGEIF